MHRKTYTTGKKFYAEQKFPWRQLKSLISRTKEQDWRQNRKISSFSCVNNQIWILSVLPCLRDVQKYYPTLNFPTILCSSSSSSEVFLPRYSGKEWSQSLNPLYSFTDSNSWRYIYKRGLHTYNGVRSTKIWGRVDWFLGRQTNQLKKCRSGPTIHDPCSYDPVTKLAKFTK